MSSRKFFTRFSPPASPSVECVGGLTQQHFKDDCDISTILKRYCKTGVPPPVSPGVYADLTEMPQSLDEAYDRIAVAQEWFDSLPSEVRSSFDNDVRVALRLVNTNPSAAVAAGLLPGAKLTAGEANLSPAVETAAPEPPKNKGGTGEAVEVPKPDPKA